MKTFHFSSKNSSASITLSAETFDEAEQELPEGSWSCDDPDGEDEDF